MAEVAVNSMTPSKDDVGVSEPSFLEPVDEEEFSDVDMYLDEEEGDGQILVADGGRIPEYEERLEDVYRSKTGNNAVLGTAFTAAALGNYAMDQPVVGTLLLAAAAGSFKRTYDSMSEPDEEPATFEDVDDGYKSLRNERLMLSALSGAAGAAINPLFFVPAAYYGAKGVGAQRERSHLEEYKNRRRLDEITEGQA